MGTASLRRKSQMLHKYPSLSVRFHILCHNIEAAISFIYVLMGQFYLLLN